jgi:hypothetical protein
MPAFAFFARGELLLDSFASSYQNGIRFVRTDRIPAVAGIQGPGEIMRPTRFSQEDTAE